MYSFIKPVHSVFAYAFFLVTIIAIIYFILRLTGNKEFESKDKKMATFVVAIAHIQLILGLILYFVSPVVQSAFEDPSAGMKNPGTRFFFIEHITTNILGVIAITVGSAKSKRKTISKYKFKTVLLFFCIGIALVASRTPWFTWLAGS